MRTARKWLLRVAIVGSVVAGFALPTSQASASPLPAAPSDPSLASIQKQITDQTNALDKIVEQYDGVNTLLARNMASEAAVKKQLGPTLSALDTARTQIASIAAHKYMAGGSLSTMNAFVSSDSTQDLAAGLAMLDRIAAAQHDQIVNYQTINAKYLAEKQKLDTLIAAENAQKQSLAAQKKTINTKLAALYKLRTAAYGQPTESAPTSRPSAPSLPGRGGKVVDFAYAQLGKPYEFAADGPGSYDCSGLTMAAYRSVGVSLPHNAAMQWDAVPHVSKASLSPGDLVFYSGLGHVAIYIGNSKIIAAPHAGTVVKIQPIGIEPIAGYGRP